MATAVKPKTKKRGKRPVNLSREKLLATVVKAMEEKGRPVSVADCNNRKFGLQPLSHYVNEFGSIQNAVSEASGDTPSPKLEDALEKAWKPAAMTAHLTITKNGASAEVTGNIADLTKLIRFAGDDSMADMLNAFRQAYNTLPHNGGVSYSFGAEAGGTTVALKIG